MKIQVAILSLGLALAGSTAYAGEYSCGCYTPPPVKHGKVKANAGVGNGSEVLSGNADESGDVDPGNSLLNNKAGTNVDKPNSPRAGTVNTIMP
jgi:hypothetical protein